MAFNGAPRFELGQALIGKSKPVTSLNAKILDRYRRLMYGSSFSTSGAVSGEGNSGWALFALLCCG
jgi:hypothetical protein